MPGIDPRRVIQGLIADLGPEAIGSVWWGPVGGPPRVAIAEGVPHYAASTMKLSVAIAAHELIDRGHLDPAAEVLVHVEFDSVVPGRRFELQEADDQDPETWGSVGGRLSIAELLRRSLVLSGNLATDLLLEQIGTDAVAAVIAAAGCGTGTRLPLGIGDTPARDEGWSNTVTAADLALLLRRTPAAVETILLGQTWREAIPAGLPDGTHVASKSGWVDGVAHDAALIRPADASDYVLVVLTTSSLPTASANGVIAAISRVTWDHRNG